MAYLADAKLIVIQKEHSGAGGGKWRGHVDCVSVYHQRLATGLWYG